MSFLLQIINWIITFLLLDKRYFGCEKS